MSSSVTLTKVLEQIFDYVKLEDLLELASSSKELYSLFTSRPMRVLWEKMWSDRRLKECPDGWNVVTHTRYLLVDTCLVSTSNRPRWERSTNSRPFFRFFYYRDVKKRGE